jgi:hypothetical protein
MDEYIKREDAIKATTYVGTAVPTDIIPLTLYAAQKNIRKIPAADVAPKSESELDSIPVEAAEALKEKAVEKAKAEVAREIFGEIEELLRCGVVEHSDCLDSYVKKGYVELKKKYTEGKEGEGK